MFIGQGKEPTLRVESEKGLHSGGLQPYLKIVDWSKDDFSTRVGCHPNLTFTGKVRGLPLEWSPKRGSTRVGSSLASGRMIVLLE